MLCHAISLLRLTVLDLFFNVFLIASVNLPLWELGCGSKQINSVHNKFRVSQKN